MDCVVFPRTLFYGIHGRYGRETGNGVTDRVNSVFRRQMSNVCKKAEECVASYARVYFFRGSFKYNGDMTII